MRLSGRKAVVTGGGRGIGAAICRALAAEGASVVVSARSMDETQTLADALVATGATATAIHLDVSDPDSIRALAEAAGETDILINNAGVAPSAKFQKVSLEQWEGTMRINATGPLLCTQAFLAGMIERGWGRVVNVASIASYTGAKYITAYAASKHALLGMTRCLATELVGTGVTVNSVCPGYVDTPMTDASIQRIAEKTGRDPAQIRRGLEADQPGGRLITTDEVAHAVMTFLPDQAMGLQGSALVVDGGGLLQ